MTTSSQGTSAPPASAARQPAAAEESGRMTHRQTLEALSGMLLAMFTAFLSSTIVSNALPTIITDLHGTQSQYTWVVTATLLASTATTPIWGKLADLFSKKLLVQLAITIFTVGSIFAGFSQSVGTLIAWRALQGLGLGGLQALIMIVMAAMISPRERGRYTGVISTVMSVAPVAGPLIGGVIVDTDWLGWRWCFWVGAPLAVLALIVVQRTLNLPVVKRKVSIDYLGAALIAGGVSALLIWVTLAGNQFAWGSGTSLGLAGLGALLIVLFLVVESRAKEPVIPLRLFRDRTTTLATIASISVGVAMFGGAVFLGQYFQIARGYSPTVAGLLMLPMIIGSTISATVSGSLITRFGRWKGYLVAGALFMLGGFGLLSTIDHDTSMVLVGASLFILGSGMGMLMQNLVLAVQNSVAATDLGSATSTVTFFRSMGGTVGVSVLGAILAARVTTLTTEGLGAAGITAPPGGVGEVGIGSLNELPPALAGIVRAAYGDATAQIFLVAGALAVVTILAVLFIREVPLSTETGLERERSEAGAPGAATAGTEPVPAVAAAANGRARAGWDTPAQAIAHAPDFRPGAGHPAPGNGTHTVGAQHAVPTTAPTAPATSPAAEPAGERPSPRPTPGPGIHGTVSRGDGAGLGGAVVTVADQGGRHETSTTTGRDGAYRLTLPTGGTYLVVAASGAYEPHAALVPVADRPARHDIALSGTSGVQGVVTCAGPGGETVPVVDAAVTLIDVQGAVSGATATDAAGRYRLLGVPHGQYTLVAAAPGRPPAAASVRLSAGTRTERNLALPARAVLRGSVTAASSGAPVGEALATLVDPEGGVVASAVTGPDGTFEFPDLAPGTYTLTARGYAPVAQVVQVTAGSVATAAVALTAPATGHPQPAPAEARSLR
ncbi:MFS transporter [Pseudonocardia kunmingensis]|nr:MFS transporter [Pseudonocardia kunmingensis]